MSSSVRAGGLVAGVLCLSILGACGLTSSPWKDARARKSAAPRDPVASRFANSDGYTALTARRSLPTSPVGSATVQATSGGKVSALLDVRDLLAPRTSFAGPRLLLQQGTELDDSEGVADDELVHTPDPAELLATLRAYTGPGPWEGDNAGSLEVTESGFLLVRTDPGTLAAIARFLGQ
ncbi:MAG: hypothetical protein AB7I19_00875 [Planctomycetota bacterium]